MTKQELLDHLKTIDEKASDVDIPDSELDSLTDEIFDTVEKLIKLGATLDDITSVAPDAGLAFALAKLTMEVPNGS